MPNSNYLDREITKLDYEDIPEMQILKKKYKSLKNDTNITKTLTDYNEERQAARRKRAVTIGLITSLFFIITVLILLLMWNILRNGEKGDVGEIGDKGRDGVNGKDGKNGKDGVYTCNCKEEEFPEPIPEEETEEKKETETEEKKETESEEKEEKEEKKEESKIPDGWEEVGELYLVHYNKTAEIARALDGFTKTNVKSSSEDRLKDEEQLAYQMSNANITFIGTDGKEHTITTKRKNHAGDEKYASTDIVNIAIDDGKLKYCYGDLYKYDWNFTQQEECKEVRNSYYIDDWYFYWNTIPMVNIKEIKINVNGKDYNITETKLLDILQVANNITFFCSGTDKHNMCAYQRPATGICFYDLETLDNTYYTKNTNNDDGTKGKYDLRMNADIDEDGKYDKNYTGGGIDIGSYDKYKLIQKKDTKAIAYLDDNGNVKTIDCHYTDNDSITDYVKGVLKVSNANKKYAIDEKLVQNQKSKYYLCGEEHGHGCNYTIVTNN